MANEGGKRRWWPTISGVNLSNGNLHFELGPGSCVTCGGRTAGQVYANPQDIDLHGPVLVYNGMGTPDTDLGPQWMLPWHTRIVQPEGGTAIVIDADGTTRAYTEGASEGEWDSDIEDDVLTDDGKDFTLTRMNGDRWVYGMSNGLLKKIVSRTGHEVTITRDGSDKITKVTDGFGRETTFHYINYGNPPGITRLNEIREPAPGDPSWYSTFLQYDDDGRLVAITNPVGETTRFEYDSSNRMVKAIDGHGHTTEYAYSGGKVSSITDPHNNTTSYAYSVGTSGNVTTVTNRLNKSIAYTFDTVGRIVKIKDPLDNEVAFAWDQTTWEMTEMLGPKIPVTGTPWSRHKTVYTYGNTKHTQHELHKVEIVKITNTDPTGTLLADEEWTYNTQHDVLTYTDPNGNTTTMTYEPDTKGDSVGLVKTVVNAENETVETNSYDSPANKYRLLSTTNGVNKTTQFAYNQNTTDSFGKPDRVTMPSGAVYNFKYDVRGRMFQYTDPSGNLVKTVYDALDRQIEVLNPDGTLKRWVYDSCHLVAIVDENGNGETYDYDNLGRLIRETDPNGSETRFEYNAEGWQTKIVDPRGKETTYAYDDIGRETEANYPGGWKVLRAYWEPGMLKTLKHEKGVESDTIEYEYDDRYRLKKKVFPSGMPTELDYDARGRLTKMKDASGEKRYEYDHANRLAKVVQGPQGFVAGTNHNYELVYDWDSASRLTKMTLTIRTLSALTWQYDYTDDSLLKTVTNPDSDETLHEYLTDLRLKKITLKSQTADNKSTREYFYQDTDNSHQYVSSANKHLRKVLDKKQGGAVISEFEYLLDKAGIRRGMSDMNGKFWQHGYDPKYQLVNETKWSNIVPGTREYQYALIYDPNGNRILEHRSGIETKYAYGDNNEMLYAGDADFTYDLFGNTTTKTVGSNVTTYHYDFESHLIKVEYPSGPDDEHEYDGNGRRMRSNLAGASLWTNFVYDEVTGNLIAEYTLDEGTYALQAANTWGLGLISTNRGGTKRYFHFDGLGSTGALTDFNEEVTDRYEYAAFGELVSISSVNGPSVNPFRFVGQWGYYEDEAMGSQSGLLLLGTRYFSPEYGRFWTWDPLEVTSSKLYPYVKNDPTNQVAPSGLAMPAIWLLECWLCLQRVGARAREAGKNTGLPGPFDGAQDAFRHCWASCAAARECGYLCAKLLDLREWEGTPSNCMDLWNNKIGRKLSRRQGTCFDLCMGAVRDCTLIKSPTDPRCSRRRQLDTVPEV